MGRMTRAKAAEVAERLHIDEDAVLNLDRDDRKAVAVSPLPDRVGRAPLGEITPNSAGSTNEEGSGDGDESRIIVAQKQTRSKENKSEIEEEPVSQTPIASVASTRQPQKEGVLQDGIEAAPSPASQAASDDLMKDVPECKCNSLGVVCEYP